MRAIVKCTHMYFIPLNEPEYVYTVWKRISIFLWRNRTQYRSYESNNQIQPIELCDYIFMFVLSFFIFTLHFISESRGVSIIERVERLTGLLWKSVPSWCSPFRNPFQFFPKAAGPALAALIWKGRVCVCVPVVVEVGTCPHQWSCWDTRWAGNQTSGTTTDSRVCVSCVSCVSWKGTIWGGCCFGESEEILWDSWHVISQSGAKVINVSKACDALCVMPGRFTVGGWLQSIRWLVLLIKGSLFVEQTGAVNGQWQCAHS